jgi:hypothetical protein
LRLRRKIGAGIILVSMAPFFYYIYRVHSHEWTPLKVPVSFAPGKFQSPEFKTDLNGRYIINLSFQQQASVTRQQCLMGFPTSNGECSGQTVDFDWELVNNFGAVVQSGSYKPLSFSGSEVTFAEFQSKRGVTQSVVLQIKRDGGELNTANTRLEVQVGPEYWEVLPDLYRYSLLWAKIVGALGVLWIVVPIAFESIKRLRR